MPYCEEKAEINVQKNVDIEKIGKMLHFSMLLGLLRPPPTTTQKNSKKMTVLFIHKIS